MSGEGIDGFGVSNPGVFEDSPFSDFVEDRVSFLLGAIYEFSKALKKEEEFLEREITEILELSKKNDGSQGFKKRNEVQWICTPQSFDLTTWGKTNNECEQK